MLQIKEHKNELKAVMAIVLYSDDTGTQYAESMEIIEGAAKNIVPLELETMSIFNDMGSNGGNFYCEGIIPPHIKHYTKDSVVWSSEPQRRVITYKKEVLHIKTPKLIFKWAEDELYVYAWDGEDQLFYAPFWNIHHGNDICMGTAPISESREISEFAREMEWSFFGSEFNSNHANHYDLKDYWNGNKQKQELKEFDYLENII